MAATLRLQVQVGPQEEDLEEADDMPKAKIARPRLGGWRNSKAMINTCGYVLNIDVTLIIK